MRLFAFALRQRPVCARRLLLPFGLLAGLLLVGLGAGGGLGTRVPRVLVLNSYHPGYNWSDGEQAAVLRTLAEGRPDILPSVEYMDWRRFPSQERSALLLAQLELKYDAQPFDLVIALDDPAVSFVTEHREFFGAKVPVVFGGVNDVEVDRFAAMSEITGVAQTYDFSGTLELIRLLQPEVRKVLAVHCRTESGLAARHSLQKVIERSSPPFDFEWFEGWTAESLLQRVSRVPDDTAVLLVSIFRDETGRVLVDDPEFGRNLPAQSRVPVYFVAPPLVRQRAGDDWETAVWQGMGGSLMSESRHGDLVGRLALRVLAGESAESIPIVAESPARTAFDYLQLARFGISPDRLPPGAEVFHAPQTFYQVHRGKIVGGIVVIVVLAGIVVLLLWVIFQRRRAELALRRSHAHFELIAKATNDAVWDWDLSDGTMWWNAGYVAQLKLPPRAEMGFAAWEAHIDPADRAWLVQSIRDGLHEGRTHWAVEYRVRRSDGAVRHVLDRIFVERPADGAAARVLGARIDLTDRMLAERERARLATAVEQSAEAILLFEPDGTVLYSNPAFERATGLPAPKVFTGLCALFRHGEGTEGLQMKQVLAEVQRTGRWASRLEGVRRDGSTCTLQVSISVIRDQREQVEGFVFVGEDVTREAKLEDQVRLSQKMEAVGLLAGGIAHDFNNLLQVISGFAVQAQEADDKADRDDCLAQIADAARRATQLTRQLLVFSRDDKSSTLVDIELNELLSGQIKMLQRLLDASVEVDFKPASESGNVRGDRGQIEQVVMNLCINARDAMPGGGRISLSAELVEFDEGYCTAHPWAKAGRFMQVAVADNGSGMDKATLARVFDPFFTTKPKGKGTGLGLAIVYGIIQKHGGLIHVYSEPGVGTTFRLFFPVCRALGGKADTVSQAAPVGGSGLVLLVEDDPSVSKLATRVLERAGYEVLSAESGDLAWELFQTHAAKVRVVVLDAILPKLSGREIYERIRRMDPQKPILFCSGYSAGTIQPEFFPGDDVKMLGKPYNPADLLRIVGELCAKGAD